MRDYLPKERLATTSESGQRVYLYPQSIEGKWQNRRNIVTTFLIFLFIAVPWIKLSGRPILLLDVIHRKFNVFGLQFWATDVPMVVMVFLAFVIFIALVTSVLGRAWCGWSCPQTVFVDGIFRRIERWVEGDGFARKKLDESPLSLEKLMKKATKWSSFLFVSWVISHSFLAYFIGADEIMKMIQQGPVENWATFQAVWAITAVVAFDFGWFREQFCTIVCPYGRIQSVFMDQHSLNVQYDTARNDCVDCGKCVRVCPTGIDIRRGLQMECIGCTACIDACDSIMTKLNLPEGLIRYDSQIGAKKRKTVRPKTVAFGSALILIASLAVMIIFQRKSVEFTLLRAHDDPYRAIEGSQPTIVNHFKLKMKSRAFAPVEVNYRSADPSISLAIPVRQVLLKEAAEAEFEFFVTFPKKILSEGRARTTITLTSTLADRSIETQVEEVTLIGPF